MELVARFRGCPRSLAALTLSAVVLLAACSSRDGTGPGTDRPGPASGADVFALRDNGIRCITNPCFTVDAVPIDPPGETRTVSDVDLSALDLSEAELDAVTQRLHSSQGITVAGRIDTVPNAGPAGDGRVLRVSRLIDPELGS